MRDLIITENITLDGVVEATANWFGPAGSPSEVDQSDHEQAIRDQREAADAFLVGRVTTNRCAATGHSRPMTPPASPTT